MPFQPPIPDPKQRGRFGLVGSIVQAEKMIQVALILPCAAVIGWLLGGWLGGKFHLPWLGIVGIVFGGISGLVYVIRMAMAAVNSPAEDDCNGKGSGGRP
jgi:ATP synthase protein I